MRNLLLLGLLGGLALSSCTTPGAKEKVTKSQPVDMTKANELHAKIMKRFAEKDFTPIDGEKIFGKGREDSPSSTFVTKKSRDEVLGIFSEIIDPYVASQAWADDYGQYHIFVNLKGQPNVWIGMGISFLKMKKEAFKDHPEIINNYDTDIIYSYPYIWEPQQ